MSITLILTQLIDLDKILLQPLKKRDDIVTKFCRTIVKRGSVSLRILPWVHSVFLVIICLASFLTPVIANTYTQTEPLLSSISIATSKYSFPQHFINEQGQPAGIMVDFWQLWSEKTGVKVDFKALNWPDSIAQVASGDIDIHAGLTFIGKRAELLAFSDAVYPHFSYVYIHKSLGNINKVSMLSPYAVGVVQNASHPTTLVKANPAIQIKQYPNRFAMYKAALVGEIFAFAEIEQLDKSYENYSQLIDLFPRYKRINYYAGEYGAATAKGNEALLTIVNQGIGLITVDERQALANKWLKQKRMTDVLNIAFSDNLAPYMGHSLSGQPQGLHLDIWKLWSKYSGIDINFVADTMSGGIAQVKTGLADLHLAYPEKEPSTTGLRKAKKVYGVKSKVFVSMQYGEIGSLADLKGKAIGIYPTSPYLSQLKEEYPDIELKFFSDSQSMLSAADSGQIAAVVIEVETMKVQLVNANMQSSFYILPEPVFYTDIYALVGSNNEQLAQFIRAGFDLIPIEELQKIERDWLGADDNHYFQQFSDKLLLTQEEQKWVLDNPVVTVGATGNWAPMEYINNDGEVQGINRDIIELVAKATGLTLEFKGFDDWASLLDAFNHNEVDLILGISNSEERDKIFDFSNVYSETPWSVIHKQSFASERSLSSFNGKSLAFIKGYQIAEKVKAMHPDINIVVVDNVEQGLVAVQKGIVNGFVEVMPVAANLLKRESLVPLAISIVDELSVEHNRVAMHKGNTQLKNIINKGLVLLTEERRQEIFNRWFNVNIQTGLDQRFVAKVAAQIGMVLLVIIGVIAYWNRRLSREVTLRKKLEERMKHMATHDELTGLANRALLKSQLDTAIAQHQRQQAKFAILFADLDGFKGINDEFGHDAGDKVLKQVASRIQACTRRADTVSRFGGDEFVILLSNIHNKEEAGYIAEKIIAVFDEPFALEQGDRTLGSSIGIAVYPDDGETGSDLLKMSDTLMYRVKSSGKNNYLYR